MPRKAGRLWSGLWSRLGAVNVTGAWGMDPESGKRAKSHSWGNWKFGYGLCDSSIVSRLDVLNLIFVLWLHERNVFVLTKSMLKYLRVAHHVSATYFQLGQQKNPQQNPFTHEREGEKERRKRVQM